MSRYPASRVVLLNKEDQVDEELLVLVSVLVLRMQAFNQSVIMLMYVVGTKGTKPQVTQVTKSWVFAILILVGKFLIIYVSFTLFGAIPCQAMPITPLHRPLPRPSTVQTVPSTSTVQTTVEVEGTVEVAVQTDEVEGSTARSLLSLRRIRAEGSTVATGQHAGEAVETLVQSTATGQHAGEAVETLVQPTATGQHAGEEVPHKRAKLSKATRARWEAQYTRCIEEHARWEAQHAPRGSDGRGAAPGRQ